MKIANIGDKKVSYVLNNLRTFNNIIRKDVTYDYVKIHKKAGLHHHSEKSIFEKT